MKFSANSERQASIQLLDIIWRTDYKTSWHPTGFVATEYVYFDSTHCRFYFRSEQERSDRIIIRQLVKRYSVNESYDAIEIVATKYTFCKLLLGAVAHRKLLSYSECFELYKKRPELF